MGPAKQGPMAWRGWQGISQWLRSWSGGADSPPVDDSVFLQRIRFVERGVAVPAKAVVLLVLLYLLFVSRWFLNLTVPMEEAWNLLRTFFLIYFALNVGASILFWGMDEVPARILQRVVYSLGILDAVGLAALTLVTGGFDSILYWLFLGLIIRNAAVIPYAEVQISVNLLGCSFYLLAGSLERVLNRTDLELIEGIGRGTVMGAGAEGGHEPVESLILRMLLLLLMTACCYGIQVLLDRRRREEREADEFAVKQHQLEAAGRLAAEIAHQLKNPLGIINNAAYTLQRTVKEGKTITQQIAIIREEVARSDRIITELMGYAQLAEGKVERISVTEELDRSIEASFPPGMQYPVKVRRDYGPAIPLLLGQRGHFSEIFTNLLTNAREALNGPGALVVSARATPDYEVEIRVQDNGPGIPAELHGRLFEAYFTTKERGTGLGLAIVRHNAELYGGSVRVESILGKGATFIVLLPARSVMRMRR
jgi:signal transduction histidine kinase